MRITMIGSGYVGLASGVCFADFGHDVTRAGLLEQKIAALKDGQFPVFEAGLGHLVADNAKTGRLSGAFSFNLARQR